MGHTIGEWRDKVAQLLRDQTGVDLKLGQIEDTGLKPALAEFSADHPYEAVVEVAGDGSAYFDLPDGWDASSVLTGVEYPANLNPLSTLHPSYFRVVRSIDDVTVQQILLRFAPPASENVRFTFTARWPYPTDATGEDLVDLIGDTEYEAVTALAAAYCCESLAAEASRGRDGAFPTDLVAGDDRTRNLSAMALRLREQYERLVGDFWGVV